MSFKDPFASDAALGEKTAEKMDHRPSVHVTLMASDDEEDFAEGTLFPGEDDHVSSSPSPSSPKMPMALSLWVLFLIALLSCGPPYFAYHAPGAMADMLKDHFELNEDEFGLLFTVYSIPNTFMVLIAGVMIDKLGINFSSLFFISICSVGSLIFTAAYYLPYPLLWLLLGRTVLGFGGESLTVCQQTMLGRWFTGSFLNFAFGFTQAFVQLFGSALVFFMLPFFSLITSMWIVVIFTGINIFANFLYVLAEWWWAKKYIQAEYEKAHAETLRVQREEKLEREKLLSIQEPLEEKPVVSKCTQTGHFLSGLWADIKELPFIYWMVVMMIFCLSPILYTFTAFGPLYFEAKWHLDPKEAGSITSVLYATILFAPVAGWIMDRFGYRSVIQVMTVISLPVWFSVLYFTQLSPLWAMIAIGLAYSVTESNGYAMVPLLVQGKVLGMANGIMMTALNTCLFGEPYIVGELKTRTGDYNISTLMFIAICGVGWIFSLVILFLDFRGNKILLKTAKERETADSMKMQFMVGEQLMDDDGEPLVAFGQNS